MISPVTLTKTQDLVFGQVVRPSNSDGNTVTIDTNDTVTLTGLGNGSVISSTTSSAKFNVIAAVGTTYTTTQTLAFVGGALTGVGPALRWRPRGRWARSRPGESRSCATAGIST